MTNLEQDVALKLQQIAKTEGLIKAHKNLKIIINNYLDEDFERLEQQKNELDEMIKTS